MAVGFETPTRIAKLREAPDKASDGVLDAAQLGDKDWDVDAAFHRLAGNNVEEFKRRIRERAVQYCADQDGHLSFDEIQAAIGNSEPNVLSPEVQQHLRGCEFCRELMESIAPTDAHRESFLRILDRYETQTARSRTRPQQDQEILKPVWEPAWEPAMYARRAWHGRPLVVVAGLVLVIGVGVALWNGGKHAALKTANTQLFGTREETSFDWGKASSDCKADSERGHGCDMLVAAAALMADGKPVEARPVFIRGLQDVGVNDNTVSDINAVLASTAAADETQSEAAVAWMDSGPKRPKAAAEKLLAAAKLDFQTGRPLLGYERLGTYAMHVSAEPQTARALDIAFVQPIREIWETRDVSRSDSRPDSSGTQSGPDASDSATRAVAAAAASETAAKH